MNPWTTPAAQAVMAKWPVEWADGNTLLRLVLKQGAKREYFVVQYLLDDGCWEFARNVSDFEAAAICEKFYREKLAKKGIFIMLTSDDRCVARSNQGYDVWQASDRHADPADAIIAACEAVIAEEKA